MRQFSVSSRGYEPVEVEAPNWVAALGLGLEGLGYASELERLACELLPNGTVIARDISNGTGFIVQQVHEPADGLVEIDPVELEPIPEDAPPKKEPKDVLAAIAEAPSASSAASLALTLARKLVPAESGAVILDERGYLRFVSVVGPSSRRLVGVRLPLGTGVAGFAMERRRIVVLDDAQKDPRHCGEVDALTGYRTQQIAVVPIVKDQRCFGVIELMNLDEGKRFGQQEVKAIRKVARVLAERLAD